MQSVLQINETTYFEYLWETGAKFLWHSRCTQIKTYSWDNAQVILVGNKCDMVTVSTKINRGVIIS
jgi:hypothetical protein